jgi:hypothetical protein
MVPAAIIGVELRKFLDRAEEMGQSCLPRATYEDNPGVVKANQAGGDFQILAERGRRALRVHLGADVRAGLRILEAAIRQALA